MQSPPTLSAGQVINRIRRYFSQCGYATFELPLVEPASLFLIKAGDRIFQSLFTFESNNQVYALRPEFTAQALEQFVLQGKPSAIARWQFEGQNFRRDVHKPVAQQSEIGLELLGIAGSSADAEVIGTAINALGQAGVQDLQIALGNIDLLRQVIRLTFNDSRIEQFLLSNLDALQDQERGVNYVLDLYDRISFPAAWSDLYTDAQVPDRLVNDLIHKGNATHIGTRTPDEIAARIEYKMQRAAKRPEIESVLKYLEALSAISDKPSEAFPHIKAILNNQMDEAIRMAIENWEKTVRLLESFEVDVEQMIRISPTLTRSWDYYTGIVFDIYHEPTKTHLGGGGRYDDLARLMGAPADLPAIGLVLYSDQIDSVVSAPDSDDDAIGLQFTEEGAAIAFQWATRLRKKGISVHLNHGSPPIMRLTVNVDGSLGYDGTNYSLAEFDSLTAALFKKA
jgi:histidyl-tRNA synthetase